MPLTETAIKQPKLIEKAKEKGKPYKLADERGLFLLVSPNGSKWWRLKYRIDGKEKLLSLGVYPDVGLKDARERRDEARKQIADGIDPSLMRQAHKAAKLERATNSFEAVSREWHAKCSPSWSEGYSSKRLRILENDVFPWLGARPIAEIKAVELLNVLRRIEGRGAIEVAHRVRATCGRIFRYAIATQRAERDWAADLRGPDVLKSVKVKHHASFKEPKEIGPFLRDLAAYKGSPVTKAALQLAPLVFLRPGELRHAEWSEIDLDNAEWRIAAEKMKGKNPHIVPLSTQSVSVLRELRPITGEGRYAFPSVRTLDRPMSENTVNAALRRLGYERDEMTGHGFRSMASTLLNENGWNRDAIERQLAHKERNEVRDAYNAAKYLPERRKMMQWWADYLDKLAAGAEIIPLKKGGKAA
jgi:integrase